MAASEAALRFSVCLCCAQRERRDNAPVYVAWSPDETQLATVLDSGAVDVWDVATGKQVAVLGSHPGASGVAWSPNGTWIAAVGGTHVSVWDAATGQLAHTLAAEAADGCTKGLAWTPDSKLLASCVGGTVLIWDNAGSFVQQAAVQLPGSGPAPVRLRWNPDGNQLVICGKNIVHHGASWDEYNALPDDARGYVDCYDEESDMMWLVQKPMGHASEWFVQETWGTQRPEWIDPRVETYVTSPCTGLAAECIYGHYLNSTTVQVCNASVPSEPQFTFEKLAWSADGQQLAGVGNYAGRERGVNVVFWDVHTWQTTANVAIDQLSDVFDVEWSPDGTMLAILGHYKKLAVLQDHGHGRWQVTTVDVCDQDGKRLAWSPTSDAVAIFRNVYWVDVYAAPCGTHLFELRLAGAEDIGYHVASQASIHWSPDGQHVATRYVTGKTVSVGAMATLPMTLQVALQGAGGRTQLGFGDSRWPLQVQATSSNLGAVVMSPDWTRGVEVRGASLAIVCVATGTEEHVLSYQAERVRWSPDGNLVVAWPQSRNDKPSIWIASSGRQLVQLEKSSFYSSIDIVCTPHSRACVAYTDGWNGQGKVYVLDFNHGQHGADGS